MDNFLKYLYDKIPMEKESLKYDEVYKISSEIVEYLAKVSEVTVHILADEIIIVY